MSQDQQYTINLEDGRSIKVNAPSREAAELGAQRWAESNPVNQGMSAEQQGRLYGQFVSQAIDAVPGVRSGSGLVRGLQVQDELTGAAAALTGAVTGRDIDPQAAAQYQREDIELYRGRNPIRATAEEIIPQLAIAAPSRVGAVVEGAVTGGGVGFASGTGFGERVQMGAQGAAIGGLTGLLSKGLGPALNRVSDAFRRTPFGASIERSMRRQQSLGAMTNEEADAFVELAQSFRQDGMGPDEIDAALRAMQSGEKAALIDLIPSGGAVEELLGNAARETSAARLALTARSLDLNDESVGVVQQIIRDNVGSGRVRPTLEAFEQARREASEPLYEAFRQQRPIIASRLNEEGFPDAPAFTRAFEDAVESALNGGDAEAARQLNAALIRGTNRGRPTLRIDPNARLSPDLLNRVKLQLDNQIDRALSGANPDRGLARDLIGLRNRYVSTLDRIYPDTYAAARSAYAGETANLNAVELGRDMFKTDIEELDELVKAMGESEREAFRIGASTALSRRLDGVSEVTGNAESRFLNPATRQRLSIVLGGDEAADSVMSRLRRERNRRRIAQRVTPNRAGGDEELKTAGEAAFEAVTEGLNFQPGSVVRSVVRYARQGLSHESRMRRNQTLARIATDVNQLDRNAQEIIFRQLGDELGEPVEQQVRNAVQRVSRGLGVQFSQREDPLTAERVRNMRLSGL